MDYKKRNKNLYRNYKKGKTYRWLSEHYKICMTRVQQILRREKQKEWAKKLNNEPTETSKK